MNTFIRDKLGRGVKLNIEQEETTLEDIEDVLYGSESEEGSAFEIVHEQVEGDSAGEGPYVMFFEYQEAVIINREEGCIYLTQYSWNLDEYLERQWDEYEGDIYVYKLTKEIESYIQEYKNAKEKEVARKIEEGRKIRERLNKEREEAEKRKKEERVQNRERYKEVDALLLRQGFEQQKSKKGNLISQYKKLLYQDGFDLYDSRDEFLARVEDKQGKELVRSMEDVILRRLGRVICFKITRKGELGVVKSKTDSVLMKQGEIYTGVVNNKVRGSYSVPYYLKEQVEDYVEQGVNSFKDIVLDKSEKDKKQHKKRVEMFEEINKMFL